MSYKFEWISGNAHLTFSGDIDFEEINKASYLILGDSKFDSMKYAVFNYLAVDNFNVTKEDIVVFSSLNSNAATWNNSIKLAFTFNDEYIKEMIVEYINLMKGLNWDIKYFDNLEEALDWCNS